ncbi:MAG: proline dehydrogenase family protein [Candidatus Bipolaricaulota bacterium]|nr:proline dehydrogenase family protein [Candidatus Bipolaricaulota bacterium]MCS7273956.1 proline dehydrogenase family protein [Candidatus Bipolaricaulota bacterium]MDW8111020.1 proline dehydrogenase family protein [Candidatus Bipolaricaulota bacterium]MDW8329281.1 proline dehydrogenase family protein [Candidatus Bipolaricaulota bacterium]
MMRTMLLKLSQNSSLREAFSRYRFAQRAARRFIAGERLSDAIAVVHELNRQKILATLDHLGENTTNEREAIAAADEYLAILDAIARTKVQSEVSLKLTQMGLDIRYELCLQNLRRILERARAHQNFVCVDMESSAYTDRTLDLYEALRREGFDNVGPAIQAYLRRSERDLERLIEWGVRVRLCKGAYQEPPSIAFARKRDVDANYIKLLEMLFSPRAQERGVYPAIATHDEKIIRWAIDYVREHKIPKDRFEFQMLYGIRRDLQLRLAQEGYRVRVYVSYGTHWYPYFMRRLAERPANLLFLVKNLLRG